MDTHDNALQIPNPQHFPLKAYHMPRQRIDKLLEAATRCKLVFVLAGAGYGKTQAVRHYIEEQGEAIVRWLQLDENDNIAARYWEKLVYNISFDNPDLADKLRKFGFPDTSARFNQFGEILKSAEHRAHRTFLVLDDFHLIHSKEALAFAQRCAYLEIPGACVILISRKEPEINVVSLFAKGQVHIITEDELRFADIEISEYLRRQNVPFSADGLANIIEATRGWALAVQLLALSLKRMPENLEFAIDVMKQNIFKLMEIEAFEDFSPEAKKTMVKLSLISSLPLTALQKLFCDDSFLQGAPGIESFVWFDSLTGEDRIHPLYGEFLRSKQDILSFEEKQDTYRQAAKWCYENNFSLDAVRYYFMLQDYKCVLDILLSYPFKQSYSACEYFFGILKELDQSGAEEKAQEDRSVLLLKNLFLPLLLLWMDRYEEAESRCFAAIASWEHSSSPLAPSILCAAHSCLSYINLYTCTFTHKYDFFDHLKKAVEHFSKSSLPPIDIAGPFGVADIRSFACLIGEGASLLEFDKF
ncbi:MAG: hypothetical protein FWH48_07945, partial [Oscillospiraceae bacterium]|nr:hypothetical protein [Oscillospiraceae bacterium]